MTQLILFDFDGTLVDSLAYSTAIFRELAPRFGLRLPPDLETARAIPTKVLFREMGLSWWKLPRVVRAFQAEAAKGAAGLQLFADWPDVLTEFRSAGYRLGIVSSNREDAIRTCLATNGVEAQFEFVVGYPRLFGKAKALRRILRREKLDRRAVVYVGDETRDIDAANAVGVRAIGVTWGYHALPLLQSASPHAVADTPHEVARLVIGDNGVA